MTLSKVLHLLGELRFEGDDRAPPDNRRRGQFRAGWEDFTVRRRQYYDRTLDRLKWHNLGYRFGERFGAQTREEINKVYDLVAGQYDRARSDGPSAESAIASAEASDIEGMKTEVTQLRTKRSRRLRDLAFEAANGVCCVCDRDFSRVLEGRTSLTGSPPKSARGS
jgi:hypothetical protein